MTNEALFRLLQNRIFIFFLRSIFSKIRKAEVFHTSNVEAAFTHVNPAVIGDTVQLLKLTSLFIKLKITLVTFLITVGF